jgi:hypothetical protein
MQTCKLFLVHRTCKGYVGYTFEYGHQSWFVCVGSTRIEVDSRETGIRLLSGRVEMRNGINRVGNEVHEVQEARYGC